MALYDYEGEAVSSCYQLDGTAALAAYDVSGEQVWPSVDYSDYTVGDYCSCSVTYMQGFDIYADTIFQFEATGSSVYDKMTTIDAMTGTVISKYITAKSDHGDSASFSREFYDSGDEFPLLYVTADTNPAVVYVNRVTTTSSTLIRTLTFPLNKTGYYAGICLNGHIAYMVGYKENNYQTDDGGANTMVVSKWDLTQLTDNGDNTFTPAFISSYERPFIFCIQGQQYHDGMLWLSSGYWATHGYIYAIDAEDGTLLHTIDTNTTTELEGVAWISQNEMVYGLAGATYKKVTFAEVSNT